MYLPKIGRIKQENSFNPKPTQQSPSVCFVTDPASEGNSEAEGNEEREHLIIRHRAFLNQNMQHVPFISTNSALCVGTVHYLPVWMEVSVQLIVALLLLEAYGLTAVEILLTVCGVQCLFVACQGFPEQIIQQAPRPAGCSDSERPVFVFLDRRILAICVSVLWVLREHRCVHQFFCVLQESEVFVWFCERRVMGGRHTGASNTNKAAEPQNEPPALWLYRASVHFITSSNTHACGFIANVRSGLSCIERESTEHEGAEVSSSCCQRRQEPHTDSYVVCLLSWASVSVWTNQMTSHSLVLFLLSSSYI